MNLPSLPAPTVREDIEWCNIWLADVNATGLPRVLLIGDSISQNYYPLVQERLKGIACVSRLSTSAALDATLLEQIAMVLRSNRFDVIHFNHGLHGWHYDDEGCRNNFPKLVDTITHYAPDAHLIWATITPVRVAKALDQIDPLTDRVRFQNQVAADYFARTTIPINDLFALAIDHPEYYSPDGTHFAPAGVTVQAGQVADTVSRELTPPRAKP